MGSQQKTPHSPQRPSSHQPSQTHHSPNTLSTLDYEEPRTLHLRDGEVVLFKRSHSVLWQCRYKLADGSWQRASTRRASIEAVVAVATDVYDQSRYRQKLGLAHPPLRQNELLHPPVLV